MYDFLTPEEEAVYMWQYRLHGSFMTKLFEAIMRADSRNLARLCVAFPYEVRGYCLFTQEEGWWQEVERKVREVYDDV